MNNLQELFEKEFASFILPDRRDIVQYCLEEIELCNPPFNLSGPLDLSLSRYLIEPIRTMAHDDKCRECVWIGCPRTGKTLILMAYLLWALANSPANILLTFNVKDIARDFYNQVLLPLLAHNNILNLDEDDFEANQKWIRFPSSTLRMVAVQTPNQLTSLPSRIALATEAWRYPEGILNHIRGRTNDFPYTKKIGIESQANIEGTDLHKAFMAGHQARYGFNCPQCAKPQKYQVRYRRDDGSFGGLNFDTNDYTKPDGKRNIARTLETVRYNCIYCDTPFIESDKKRLNAHGIYLPENPEAKGTVRSFTWGAMASSNVLFTQVAEKYLVAKHEWRKGNRLPYVEFYQQELGEFWNESFGYEMRQLKLGVSEITGDKSDKSIRITTADVQMDCNLIYYIIAEHNWELQTIKVIDYGKTDGFEALNQINKAKGVRDQDCLVDSGFFTRSVQKACVKYGHRDARGHWQCWLATKGGSAGKYLHDHNKTYTWYSQKKLANANAGTADKRIVNCPWVEFDANTAKDITKNLLDNAHPDYKLYLSAEAMADEDFKAQLNSERQIEQNGKLVWKPLKEHTPNHWWDCLVLQSLAGGLMGAL